MPAYEDSSFHPYQPHMDEWTVRDVKRRLDAGEPLLLLDIREPYELLISRLEPSTHIPMSEMAARWPEIPRDRPVVVFCHAGVRSVNLIQQLQTRGYTNLINMIGGIDAWAVEIDPSIPRY